MASSDELEVWEDRIDKANAELKLGKETLKDLSLQICDVKNTIQRTEKEISALEVALDSQRETIEDFKLKCSECDLELLKVNLNFEAEKNEAERNTKAMEEQQRKVLELIEKDAADRAVKAAKAEEADKKIRISEIANLASRLSQRKAERVQLERTLAQIDQKSLMLKNRNAATVLRLKKTLQNLQKLNEK